MEESQSKQIVEYTKRQITISKIFYTLIVIACLVIIGGTGWSIADFVSPTGKLTAFLTLNLGYQIAIVAGILAGLFFLLIFFFGLFKRGSKWILRLFFKVRAIEDRLKNRLNVKIAAGGLLISLIAILIGIISAIIIEFIFGSTNGSPFSGIFNAFSSGNWVLFGGVSLLMASFTGLFMIYFWKNGYYLLLKMMGSLEKGE